MRRPDQSLEVLLALFEPVHAGFDNSGGVFMSISTATAKREAQHNNDHHIPEYSQHILLCSGELAGFDI
jgi:hypothetical protein